VPYLRAQSPRAPESSRYAKGHIPGKRGVPAGQHPGEWAGDEEAEAAWVK